MVDDYAEGSGLIYAIAEARHGICCVEELAYYALFGEYMLSSSGQVGVDTPGEIEGLASTGCKAKSSLSDSRLTPVSFGVFTGRIGEGVIGAVRQSYSRAPSRRPCRERRSKRAVSPDVVLDSVNGLDEQAELESGTGEKRARRAAVVSSGRSGQGPRRNGQLWGDWGG